MKSYLRSNQQHNQNSSISSLDNQLSVSACSTKDPREALEDMSGSDICSSITLSSINFEREFWLCMNVNVENAEWDRGMKTPDYDKLLVKNEQIEVYGPFSVSPF